VHTGYLWVNLKPINNLIERDVVGRITKYGSSESEMVIWDRINPLNAELISICHLLVLLGAHHILHVSRIRVKSYRNNQQDATMY
jgi:hypothetical protein